MALNPVALQQAFIASPNPANSFQFSAIRAPLNFHVFIKMQLVAGHHYTVGTNVIPGDLVLYAPNGIPILPVGIKEYNFGAATTGTYLLEYVTNPRFVVANQPVFINVAETPGVNLTTDPSIAFGGSNATVFANVQKLLSAGLNLGAGGGTITWFLHPPNGVAAAGTLSSDTGADGDNLPLVGPASLLPTDPSPVNSSVLGSDKAAAVIIPDATTPTPPESDAGRVVTWNGSSSVPILDTNPLQITIAEASVNYTADQGKAPTMSHSLPDAFTPLLRAAETAIELMCNVQFDNVDDNSDPSQGDIPDIRVGLANLSSNLYPPNTIGFTHYNYNTTATAAAFQPDVISTIMDPAVKAVTQQANGDYLYNGTTTTVFQDMFHELLHSIGLDHNQADKFSIMFPVLTADNRFPDDNDLQPLINMYGPSHASLSDFALSDLQTLVKLLPPSFTATS